MAKYDFSGYASKAGIKCSDGRVILRDAFKHCDGKQVPLVWMHCHTDPNNVLGHAILENREDGIYAYCSFNNTDAGQNTKEMVKHGDITSMSIYANQLKQQGMAVQHGDIKEVSLVLAPANPGALIDNFSISHADGSDGFDTSEAVIYSGATLSVDSDEEIEHTDGDPTVKEVFDSMDENQKSAVYAIISDLMGSSEMEQSAIKENEGDEFVKTNVFEKSEETKSANILTHAQFSEILEGAKKCGSLKESFLAHATDYGIDPIEILFPDAKKVRNYPDWIKRDDSWVSGVLNGTNHTPFSRIKSTAADITADEARAKGYIKGNLKKDEVIKVLQRVATPTTIYKKQKLDRDDIVDITDFDVVAWLKTEMRQMLNEELARAILIGDGREVDDIDKINEDNIKPIWTDNELYAPKLTLPANTTISDTVDEIVRARKLYKGSGNPTLYTTVDVVTDMLLIRDSVGRKLYPTMAELTSALRVNNIVEVEVMEGATRNNGTNDVNLIGILVNLRDYTVGADRGGAISLFDDFDIDYNQYKYLIETRCSGMLIKPYSAVVIERIAPAG